MNVLLENINDNCRPWKRTWHTYGSSPIIWSHDDIWYTKGLGKNFLQSIRVNHKFNSDVWLSIKDVCNLNGYVKPGQMSYMFDTSFVAKKKTKSYSNDKLIGLYNLDQLDNIKLKQYYNKQYNYDERIFSAEKLLKNCDVVILECGSEPMLWFEENVCQMPFWNQFKTCGDYYNTIFHELGHWCKRYDYVDVENNDFEEIIAELTSMKFCNYFSIDYDHHLSYNYINDYLNDHKDNINLTLKQANMISLNRFNSCLQYNL